MDYKYRPWLEGALSAFLIPPLLTVVDTYFDNMEDEFDWFNPKTGHWVGWTFTQAHDEDWLSSPPILVKAIYLSHSIIGWNIGECVEVRSQQKWVSGVITERRLFDAFDSTSYQYRVCLSRGASEATSRAVFKWQKQWLNCFSKDIRLPSAGQVSDNAVDSTSAKRTPTTADNHYLPSSSTRFAKTELPTRLRIKTREVQGRGRRAFKPAACVTMDDDFSAT